jgi:hypothetical protein
MRWETPAGNNIYLCTFKHGRSTGSNTTDKLSDGPGVSVATTRDASQMCHAGKTCGNPGQLWYIKERFVQKLMEGALRRRHETVEIRAAKILRKFLTRSKMRPGDWVGLPLSYNSL